MASKKKTKKAAKKAAEACRIVEFPGGRTAEFCSHKAGKRTQNKRLKNLEQADLVVCTKEWRANVEKAARARRGKKAKQVRNLLKICSARKAA